MRMPALSITRGTAAARQGLIASHSRASLTISAHHLGWQPSNPPQQAVISTLSAFSGDTLLRCKGSLAAQHFPVSPTRTSSRTLSALLGMGQKNGSTSTGQASVAGSGSRAARNGAVGAHTDDLTCGVQGFSDRGLDEFAIAIVGDLHLEPHQMHMFHKARQQLVEAMRCADGSLLPGARVIQLGDLGGYDYNPGSLLCLRSAQEYLQSYSVPFTLVTGNHDLEGAEFCSDEDNLAAWSEVFQQRHYWAVELGELVCIGISTTRFRSNAFSAHEVYIDDEQLQWLSNTLEACGCRPILMFTHAPPQGCGLKVVHSVHVKNRCTWLNHSSNAEAFIALAAKHSNIRAWFSGHFHLSQNYGDSISVKGACAFATTGVIGPANRDGFRQSRLLKGDRSGFRLYTLDHGSSTLRLDLEHRWGDAGPPQLQPLPAELVSHRIQEGQLASEASRDADGAWGVAGARQVWRVGPAALLALQGRLLVEYNIPSGAPVGVACRDIGEGTSVVPVDLHGNVINMCSDDGCHIAALELHGPGVDVRRLERNAAGTFYCIYQQNKWRLRLAKEGQLREAQLAQA